MVTYSIVVPNLHSPVVDQTLQSLYSLDFPQERYEVIVVGQDCYNLVRNFRLVRFVETDRPYSPAKARNLGASLAEGQVIVFTDADCLPRNDWLNAIDTAFTDPDTSIVGGAVDFPENNYWTVSDNLSMFHSFRPENPHGARQLLASLNLAVRREAFRACGGFDARFPRAAGEDSDFSIRLRRAGYKLIFDPRIVVVHAPQRFRLSHLVQHGYYQGMYSTKMDPSYAEESGFPTWMRNSNLVLLLSPLLALAVTAQIYTKHSWMRRWWYSAPAIFLSKMAWCFGASRSPWLVGSRST